MHEDLQLRTQRLEAIAGLSVAISAVPDAEALSDLLAGAARDLTGARFCAVVRTATNGDEKFRTVATPGVPGSTARRLGVYLFETMLPHRKQLLLPDLHEPVLDTGLEPADIPFGSVLVTPIAWNGTVRAGLVLAKEQADDFTPQDREFMRLLSGHASVAFHNLELLADVQRREETAQQRSELLEALISNIADPVFVAAPPGLMIRMNRHACDLFGITQEEVYRPLAEYMHLAHLLGADGQSLMYDEMPLVRALAGETFQSLEVTFEGTSHPDGATGKTFSFSGAPVCNTDGDIILAIAVGHDVSAERRLRRAREELISVASHELKNPLTVIKANAQIIARSVAALNDSLLSERSDSLVRQVDRLNRLVDLLLDISRLETGRLRLDKEHVDIVHLVRESVAAFLEGEGGRSIPLHVPDRRIELQADKLRVEQVIGNLLSNAVRYSPAEESIIVSLRQDPNEVRISVADKGPGIPREDLSRIFDRYYQVAGSAAPFSGSMGMGLYICSSIVEAHDGRIWVESVLGAGSVFHFTLPLK